MGHKEKIDKPLESNEKPPLGNKEVEGECNQQNLQTASTIMQPDLLGITQMLRMVDPVQNPGNKLDYINNGTVVISKLNPNIPEFTYNKTSRKSIDNSNQLLIKTDPNCDISNMVDLSKLNDEYNNKLQKKLISKIGTTQPTCEKSRRERNAAIAGILKLSTQPTANVKLMIPDEFMKNENTDSTDTPTKEVIKRSVDRVDKWLNGAPETSKKPLYLGPIIFKKKILKSTESNMSLNTVSSEELKVSNFSPTNIANELTEKYTKRIKQVEDASMDIWSKLERDLRAKDEEIKKKSSNSSLR
ncbi:uncharacterized protein LOC123708899 isoform X1 [Pieris brassicae]|uniref:uncharacterized protein LOC123708899 isoform X1 n=2 Tax=Pieris brassicae TaxID=7116 RepID=UPI001E66201F|nr:uncharacterized protein LOC123708899 isoform X1 [Pieris brassicae]